MLWMTWAPHAVAASWLARGIGLVGGVGSAGWGATHSSRRRCMARVASRSLAERRFLVLLVRGGAAGSGTPNTYVPRPASIELFRYELFRYEITSEAASHV